ncbi:MAG: SMODS domain-containing nucleotidyltransferase [Luteimonas sp.]
MSAASLFSQFRDNIAVSNAGDISTKYCSITTRLNKDFWDTESDTAHTLQIGSYGRHTAIDGISDLDMAFAIPKAKFDHYKTLGTDGPRAMLDDVKASLRKRYDSGTKIKVDGQVVGVFFSNYHVEVLPAYEDASGHFTHGDTNTGKWNLTKPRPEIQVVNELNAQTSGNLKNACKMVRAWRNEVGLKMGGLLIDTLVFKFFNEHDDYDNATFKDYPRMFVSLFSFLGSLDEQEYWYAPGSDQRVRCKSKFQPKAKKAARRCQEAIDETEESKKIKLWKKVFGRKFPSETVTTESVQKSSALVLSFDREQFIEDSLPTDIRYQLTIEGEVRQGNAVLERIRQALRRREVVPLGRHLRFYVADCDVPEPYAVMWKVRNQGQTAIDRKMLRGEITWDKDSLKQRFETSNFSGDHYVEAYAVKDGVCVARGRLKVPL